MIKNKNKSSGGTGAGGGEWKSGGALSFYDVTDPKDGSGYVAGMDNKPKKEFFQNISVIAVQGPHDGSVRKCRPTSGQIDDWSKHKYHNVDVRIKGGPTFTATIFDYCNDCDCGSGDSVGCCTRNRRKFSTPGYLLDLEMTAAKRVLGSRASEIIEKGVVEVDYRVHPTAIDHKSLISKYSSK